MSTLCPSNLLRATNVAFIIKPVKKKKKGHKQVFQRTNTAWGILGNQGELNKQGTYRFKGTAKNLWSLDGGHGEQLGQLSNITAGRLISSVQFFTPYFINKKAV